MPTRGMNKEKILEAGKNLLYMNGYSATGIQDIADAAEVPKGSFYNYFKSKEQFAVSAIDSYTDETVEFLKQHLFNGPLSPLNRMRVMLNRWAENMFSEFKGCGCLIGNMTQEMGIHSRVIQDVTGKDFARLEAQFVNCLKDAKEAGELPETADENILGAFIYNGWQGTLVRSKSEGNGSQLKQYVLFLFDYIIPSMFKDESREK